MKYCKYGCGQEAKYALKSNEELVCCSKSHNQCPVNRNKNSKGNLGKKRKRLGQKIAWNKGLTKETDARVKKYAETYKRRIKEGEIIPSWTGKKHTEETKSKISKSRIEYLQENPDKVPYLINHSSKMSYPEKIFKNALEESDIQGWEYRYQNGIYEYDFAFLKQKIDVEIDGSTHNQEKVKKIDKRRDEFSNNNGWIVIRFTAKEVKENVLNCINELKKLL